METNLANGRKSQIHIGESIAVLFIFFILIFLGLIFYVRIYKANISLEKDEFMQLEAIKVANKVSSLPELQCSNQNIVKDNCIDIEKLNALDNIINNNEIFYFDILKFSSVSIKEIYPDVREWTLYDRSLKNFVSNSSINIPISLYEPISKKYSFGVMKVNSYAS